MFVVVFFFFNDTATPGTSTYGPPLSLHDALPFWVGLIAALAAIAMIGVAYASVPLYRLFCQVTGWGGTTQRAVEAPPPVPGKSVSVRFEDRKSTRLNSSH